MDTKMVKAMKMLSLDDAIKAVTMLLAYPDDIDKIWSCDVINNLIHAPSVEDIEPTQKWISVKDKLPMIDENVLVFAQGKEDGFIVETKIAIAYMTDCMYFGGSPIKVEPRWRCQLQFFLTDYEITHWMPLPEAPKEDDDGTD